MRTGINVCATWLCTGGRLADALARLPIPPRLVSALLLLLGGLMAPHASNLGSTILGLFYLATAWRLLAIWYPGVMPGRWGLILLMPLVLALVVFTTGLHDGRLTGTAVLIVMLGLKLLELRTRRDIHVTVFLGYFLVLTQFLYNQSLWLAIYLFAGVAALVSIQIGLNRVRVDPLQQVRTTGTMLAAALPVALVIFVLFPRLQSPLWAISTSSAVTGISDEMTLGNIGQLSRSNATAFRVQFFDRVPRPEQRYWRGPVLWNTDGRRWSAGKRPLQAPPTGDRRQSLDYEVTLEPTGEFWLFGLDIVTQAPQGARLDRNYALVAEQRVNRRFSYRASSDPDLVVDALSPFERRHGLQLPDHVAPRVRALVADWQAQTDPQQPLQLVEHALRYFREQPFVYTLSPGTAHGDPIEDFLFESRRGFCEHYAGSFALLMRLAGIPSRVVIGYQGGERNPHAEHWVIRQSDAHAWSEVWLPGHGWWRVDPTAAVAPERVEQPINPALSSDADRVVFRTGDLSALASLMREAVWFADAVDLNWHRWVIGFSAERQESLLGRFGLSHLRGVGLAALLIAGSAFAAAFVFLVARIPRPRKIDPLHAVWQRYVEKLRRAGVPTAVWYGPDTLCATACRHYPGACEQFTAISRLYVQLRYGRRQDNAQLGALRRRIRRLRLR